MAGFDFGKLGEAGRKLAESVSDVQVRGSDVGLNVLFPKDVEKRKRAQEKEIGDAALRKLQRTKLGKEIEQIGVPKPLSFIEQILALQFPDLFKKLNVPKTSPTPVAPTTPPPPPGFE